jgi:hypothetical protein
VFSLDASPERVAAVLDTAALTPADIPA